MTLARMTLDNPIFAGNLRQVPNRVSRRVARPLPRRKSYADPTRSEASQIHRTPKPGYVHSFQAKRSVPVWKFSKIASICVQAIVDQENIIQTGAGMRIAETRPVLTDRKLESGTIPSGLCHVCEAAARNQAVTASKQSLQIAPPAETHTETALPHIDAMSSCNTQIPAMHTTWATTLFRGVNFVLDATTLALARTRRRLQKLTRTQALLYGMSVLLFVIGGYATLSSVFTNHRDNISTKESQQTATNATASSVRSTDTTPASIPNMEKPNPQVLAAHTVAPSHAKYIDIPSLGVHARVVTISVDKNNVLGAPRNGYDVGWYDGSALPGETGAALFDGHSNVLGTPAVFAKLKKLNNGSKIEITKGDDTKLSYQVVSVKTVKVEDVDMPDMMVSADPTKQGINLITCGGDVVPGTLHLDSRTLVKAVRD